MSKDAVQNQGGPIHLDDEFSIVLHVGQQILATLAKTEFLAFETQGLSPEYCR
jgi:hypothetical protein